MISSSRGFVTSILMSAPPKTVKYSNAFSKSSKLFFAQKDENCLDRGIVSEKMGKPLFVIVKLYQI